MTAENFDNIVECVLRAAADVRQRTGREPEHDEVGFALLLMAQKVQESAEAGKIPLEVFCKNEPFMTIGNYFTMVEAAQAREEVAAQN
jgi:hypothetical protein